MNEVMDFEETESLNEDIFDCEYTSVDAVINEVTVRSEEHTSELQSQR